VKSYKSDIYSINDKGAVVFVKTVETLELPEAIAELVTEAEEFNKKEALQKKADPKFVVSYMPTKFSAPTSEIK